MKKEKVEEKFMKGIKKYFGIILFALSLVLSVSSAMPEIGGCVDVQAAKIKINKTKATRCAT